MKKLCVLLTALCLSFSCAACTPEDAGMAGTDNTNNSATDENSGVHDGDRKDNRMNQGTTTRYNSSTGTYATSRPDSVNRTSNTGTAGNGTTSNTGVTNNNGTTGTDGTNGTNGISRAIDDVSNGAGEAIEDIGGGISNALSR